MRILLIGEYSRLHNSLKEGLHKLGHEVVLLGSGDGFKNYPVDIKITHSFQHPILKKLKVLLYRFTKIDLGSIEVYLKLLSIRKKLTGFDHVQLINESALKISTNLEIKFLKWLKQNNKSLFLLSCGIDYICMTYMMNQVPKYSLMTAYINNPSLKKTYQFQLSYLSVEHKKLHDYLYKNSNGVIATDFDYHLPLLGHSKYLGLIPNPINIDKILYKPISINEKIIIFHGINRAVIHKKGNNYFTEALEIIKKNYSNKIEIIVVESIPYKEYIEAYNSCHILLDQVYGYDQGYNALEAMAKGKVVFTGAEKEWLEHFNLKEDSVAINAEPNAKQIANKLEWLINNPSKILEISKNARAFIEKEHNYIEIAKKYFDTWEVAK